MVSPRSLSEPLVPFVSPMYYWYHSKRADRLYTRPERTTSPVETAPQHVLLVVVDALRPTQQLDVDLAFTTGISPATWTFPSVTSMMTGERPSDHGAVAHTHPDDTEYAMPVPSASRFHLPRDLDAAGYDTYAGCAFITPFLAVRGQFQTHRVYGDARAERLCEEYHRWRQGRERTFGYLHLGDLHAPIDPPAAYLDAHDVDTSLPKLPVIARYRTDFDPDDPECQYYREHKLRLYEAAAAYVSDQLRALFSEIREDTAVVLVGDHGESFWEHQDRDRAMSDSRPNYCYGHGGTPFDMLARVPVGTSAAVPRPVGGWPSVRDVAATLVELVTGDTDVPGRSWSRAIPDDRIVVCEATRYGAERKAAYRGDLKVIRSEADDVTLSARITPDGELFERMSPATVQPLLAALPDSWGDDETIAKTSAIVEDRLRALGYQ